MSKNPSKNPLVVLKEQTSNKISERFVSEAVVQQMKSPGAFQRELSFAMAALQESKFKREIALKSPQSFMMSMLQVAHAGLSLNPILKHGALVPRQGKIVFQPMYRGIKHQLVKSGLVKHTAEFVVYENCEFEPGEDLLSPPKHKPYYMLGKQTGNEAFDFKLAYCIIIMADGTKICHYSSRDRIFVSRNRSDAYKKGRGPWTEADVFDSMVKKTALIQAADNLVRSEDSELVRNVWTTIKQDEDAQDFDWQDEEREGRKQASARVMGEEELAEIQHLTPKQPEEQDFTEETEYEEVI